ncbi:MAG: ATP-dependent helicase [Sellimonas sp.]|nr:ATP-dependent helicase [Sellimonas sp.]
MEKKHSGGERPPLSDFNEAQREAVCHREGPCMVLAGPGSGKTAVITGRLEWMIRHFRIRPEEILVITFTKYAVKEMKERFLARMGLKHCPVTFGTFHGIYYGMLRQIYHLAPDQILTEEEQKAMAEAAVRDVERENRKRPKDKDVLLMIGKVKNNGGFSGITDDPEDRQIYHAYEKRKKEAGRIDFDDMLLLCYQLFCRQPQILKKWQERYPYSLIDEFQDSSKIQYEIIKLLAGKRANLFVVGDDDQAIYGFRGATPGIMKQFMEDFPQASLVRLSVNYRSSAFIVQASGKVIRKNKSRFSKDLEAVHDRGKPVHVQELKDMEQEAEYVAAAVKKKLEEGVPPEEISVIFRTVQDASMVMSAFMNRGIPFFMKEKAFHLFEHFIAEDMKAYFRIAMGERNRSDFLRVINRPNRYISRSALEKERTDFEDLKLFYCDKEWMLDRIDAFEEDMEAVSRMAPYAAFQFLLKKTGYQEYLKEYSQKMQIEEAELTEIVDELAQSMKKMDTMKEWIEFTQVYTDRIRQMEKEEKFTKGKTALLTMHGAKGLEYRCVYIIEAQEGSIPHRKAIVEEEIEEERRLFYVAMTRAKEELSICYVKEKNGKEVYPSRFVQELFTRPRQEAR